MSESGEKKTIERVKSLISVIPPPQPLKTRDAVVREKRVRLRYSDAVGEDEIYLSKKLAEELSISGRLLIAVPGKKPLEFKAVISDSTPPNEVWGNPTVMKSKGIADKSIVTIRGA